MHADFSKILNQAFKITFKNKWLWVFGLVLAVFSSGGSNFNSFNSGGGSSTSPSKIEKSKPANSDRVGIPGQDANGVPYNIDPNPNYVSPYPVEPNPGNTGVPLYRPVPQIPSALETLLKSIPVSYFVVLGIFLVALMVLAILISLYATSWATSSLIYGVDRQDLGVTESLTELSKKGRISAREMIKLKVIPMALLLLSLFVVALPIGVLTAISALLGLPLIFLFGIAFFIVMVLVTASINLGSVALILENLTWKQAFSKGFHIFKKYFIDNVLLYCINCVVGCVGGLASCVLLIILVPLALVAFGISAVAPVTLLLMLPFGFILILIFVGLMFLVKAIFIVFSQATWVLLYKQLVEVEKKEMEVSGAT